MKFATMRPFAAAGLLIVTTMTCDAMTLGAGRGGALIGRALDWSIPVRLEAGEDASVLCAEADVLYADTRIDPAKVAVRTSAGPEKGQVILRVSSSVTIDEPVVTVVLRVGCAVKNTRRFVLLADLPTDAPDRLVQVSPPAVANSSSGPSRRERQTGNGGANGNGSASSSGLPDDPKQSAASTARQMPARTRVAPAARPESVSGGLSSTKSSGRGLAQSLRLGQSSAVRSAGPRLQLDSAELLAETAPVLRSASQLQAVPLENEPRRAEFAALWRALNMRPDELARDMQRLDELQAQTSGLRDSTTRAQTDLGAARQQLRRAEEERYRNPLVYALLALIVALVAAALYLRHRLVNGPAGHVWWDERKPGQDEATPRTHDFNTDSGRDDWTDENKTALVAAEKTRDDDRRETPGSGSRLPESGFLPSSLHGHARGVNVHELFDIAQQADFFVSLGQHDHAIEVLLNHIRESAQTSPLPYLDLFRLYHDLGRRAEYDELRLEFNRIFNAELPHFDAFSERGDGLEAYESAMMRIQSLWNTSRVLDVIEESIFRKPDASSEAFGLEAYRELLLLYSIANELVETEGAGPNETGFDGKLDPEQGAAGKRPSPPVSVKVPNVFLPTSPQPLAAVSPQRGGGNYVPLRVATTSGERRRQSVGLDIDLSNPFLGKSSSSGDDTMAVSRSQSRSGSNVGSGWLEFDLGQLEDDSEPEEQGGNPPKH
jgi:pilus assembly protein FimV